MSGRNGRIPDRTREAILAALLAGAGLPGMEGFLTGKYGFYNAYEGGSYDPAVVTHELGSRYEITRVAVKQYPSGRVCHGPVDAALALRAERGLQPDEIESVTVVYTTGGYNMTCEPLAERQVPTSVQHAKFSLYYNVACALVRGHVDLADFTPEAIADPVVRDLARRITVAVDPALARIIPPGIVTVRLRDGSELRREVEYPLGTPENPVTFDDCAAKLRRCLPFAARPLDPARVETAIDLIARLETLDDVAELVQYFV
jgi:2-methylcitrate dehydratase PrpD